MLHDTVKLEEADAAVSAAPAASSSSITSAYGEASSHHVPLGDTGWALWSSISVRGAGFPARLVDELTAPQAIATAEALVAARAWRAERIEPAVQRIAAEIRAADTPTRSRLRELRTRMLAGGIVRADEGEDACAAALAAAAAVSADAAFRAAYEEDVTRVHERLVAMSREPRLREAMLWQSAEPTRLMAHALGPDGRAKRRRRALKQIAMRVQRYCVKNDTIGFFGPFGWGRFDRAPGWIDMTPGASLLATRELFFEGWSIDTLARGLEGRYDVRRWAAPRLKAGVWCHEGRAYRPMRSPVVLSDAERALIAACDGVRTATEVARLLVARTTSTSTFTSQPSSEQAVFDLIERLAALDILAWHLEVAPQLHPEHELRERLERIGDSTARASCLADLDELLRARDEVASAAGDADRLDPALIELESCFTRLTSHASSRRGGQVYAGRALVFEDCRRDGELRIGSSLLDDLAAPLGIMLDAARWAAAEIGAQFREHLRVCLRELQSQQPGDVDAHTFFSYVVSTVWLQNGPSVLFAPLVERFQQMWDMLLGPLADGAESRAAFPLDALRHRARELFPPRDVGWTLGRYVSPDLMIAASSADAVRRGEYEAVLGEVHCGNSIAQLIDIATHPQPRDLFDAAAEDTADETVVLRMVPRSSWIPRLTLGLVLPHYWRYQFGDDPPSHPRCRELPAGKLIVVDDGAGVVARTRTRDLQFDALELFGNPLLDEVNRVVSEFRPRGAHAPRLSIGRLTIARERWQVTPAEMPFREDDDAARQFFDLRAWGRAHGMPRCVFVKAPGEPKPWLLDFDSPVYADIFTSLMKTLPETTPVSIVEMLPGPRDLWLADRDGERFTCELRCVARPRGTARASAPLETGS